MAETTPFLTHRQTVDALSFSLVEATRKGDPEGPPLSKNTRCAMSLEMVAIPKLQRPVEYYLKPDLDSGSSAVDNKDIRAKLASVNECTKLLAIRQNG